MNKIAEIYVEEENPLSAFGTWENVLTLFKKMEEVTDEYSMKRYKNLPSKVKIYRGILLQDDEVLDSGLGVSWTTEINIAKMFALRFTELG